MAHVRIAAKNSIYLFIDNVLTRLVEFFIFIWLSRYLSQEQFGQYNFVIAYLTIFAVLADFGMISIVQREISRNHSLSPQYMGVGLVYAGCFSIILMTLAVIVFIVLRPYFGYSNEMVTIILVATPLILFSSKIKSYRKMWEVMYIVNFKINYVVVFNLLGRFLFLISLWLIVKFEGSFLLVIFAMALSDFPGFICIVSVNLNLFPCPRFSFDTTQFIDLFRQSLPILLSAVFMVIKLNVAVLIVEFYLASDQVALFATASKMTLIFAFIPAIISIVVSPILAKKYIDNYDAFLNVFSIIVKFLTIIVLPIIYFLFYYMEDLIVLLFPAHYLPVVFPAKIMIFALLFIFISAFFNGTLISSDKQKYLLIFEVMSGSLYLILNFVLIPVFGIVGAAIAVLLGVLFSHTRSIMKTALKKMFKPIIASSGIAAVLLAGPSNSILAIVFGLILFFGILILINGFDKEDRKVLEELLKVN